LIMAPFWLAAPGWQVSFALILDQKGSKADMRHL